MDPKPGAWELTRRAFTPRRIVLANIDHYYRRRIAESKKPFRQRAAVPAPDDAWSRYQMSMTGESAAAWQSEGAPTQLALLEVALAVRLYRLRHGRYPATLRDVERRWLPEVPVDLWGQRLVYRREDGEPVIYSLGPDGKDDRGRSLDLRALNSSAAAPGDLVFGKLLRRAGQMPGGR
jgi:hypothetical protein